MRIRSASILLVIAVKFCTISGAVSNAIHTVDSTSDDVGEKKHVNGFLRGDKTAHADDDEDEDDEERVTPITEGVYHVKKTEYLEYLEDLTKRVLGHLLEDSEPSKLTDHLSPKASAKFVRPKSSQGTSSKTPIIVNNEELDEQTAKTLFAANAAWGMDIKGAEEWLGLSSVPDAERSKHLHWRAFQLFEKVYMEVRQSSANSGTKPVIMEKAAGHLKQEALPGVSLEMQKEVEAAEATSKNLSKAYEELLAQLQQAKEAESAAVAAEAKAETAITTVKDASVYMRIITAQNEAKFLSLSRKELERDAAYLRSKFWATGDKAKHAKMMDDASILESKANELAIYEKTALAELKAAMADLPITTPDLIPVPDSLKGNRVELERAVYNQLQVSNAAGYHAEPMSTNPGLQFTPSKAGIARLTKDKAYRGLKIMSGMLHAGSMKNNVVLENAVIHSLIEAKKAARDEKIAIDQEAAIKTFAETVYPGIASAQFKAAHAKQNRVNLEKAAEKKFTELEAAKEALKKAEDKLSEANTAAKKAADAKAADAEKAAKDEKAVSV